jgi:hypothetical protein
MHRLNNNQYNFIESWSTRPNGATSNSTGQRPVKVTPNIIFALKGQKPKRIGIANALSGLD